MAFAEIIQSSLEVWRAHSWDWNDIPDFGSLVMVRQQSSTIFGIVYAIEMGALDSGRSPFPYKMTEQELLSKQPHIFAFLASTFSAMTVGYLNKAGYQYQIATNPPRIHAFVERVPLDESKVFFQSSEYLHLIFGLGARVGNIDELLLAIVTRQLVNNGMDASQLRAFIQLYSMLQGHDYRRLKLFLGRVQAVSDSFGTHIEI